MRTSRASGSSLHLYADDPHGVRHVEQVCGGAERVQELVDSLRVELPIGTRISVEPFTRRRRLARQRQLLGDYAQARDRGS